MWCRRGCYSQQQPHLGKISEFYEHKWVWFPHPRFLLLHFVSAVTRVERSSPGSCWPTTQQRIQTQGIKSGTGYVHRPAHQLNVPVWWTHRSRVEISDPQWSTFDVFKKDAVGGGANKQKPMKEKEALWSRGYQSGRVPLFCFLSFLFFSFAFLAGEADFHRTWHVTARSPVHQLRICQLLSATVTFLPL